MSSLPASTSQSRPVNGRFSSVHKWPVLGVARGNSDFHHGLLVDEQAVPPPTRIPTGHHPADDVPRIPLAVPPLHTPTIPAQPARQGRARPPAVGPALSVATWERVWESKAFTERDLGIPTGATTHRTGSINLDKGLLPETTDHRHYFRDTVFSALTWAPGKPGIYEAVARFHLVVKGVAYGDFDLTLSHTTSTTSKTYLQHNAMTRLRWGQVQQHVAHRHLLQRSLTLFRNRVDPMRFLIEID